MEQLEPRDPAAERAVYLHHLVQSIIGDIDYVGTNRDDEVWWQLHEIEAANGMPHNVTADEAFNLYRSNYGGQ